MELSKRQGVENPAEARRQPLVSVVTIFLNAEEFLHEAIDSVFGQTYENWELLLVDDGSTDSSSALAWRYAVQHAARIHYLEHDGHQNLGMSATRNLGIQHTKGDYIAFLDADDVWLPHKLEEQVALLEAQPEAGMVYGTSQYWYSWTGRPGDWYRDRTQAGMRVSPNSMVQPPTVLRRWLQSQASLPCPSDALVRRQAVKSVGGFEDAFRGMYEDQAFFAKIFLHTPVVVGSHCWTRYRQHANSCVSLSTKAKASTKAGLFYLSWLERYLAEQGIQDTDIWHGLRSKQWQYRHPTLAAALGRVRHPLTELRQVSFRTARRLLPAPVRRWVKQKDPRRPNPNEPAKHYFGSP